jgi:osmoprotectant transport system substrate-binding protein
MRKKLLIVMLSSVLSVSLLLVAGCGTQGSGGDTVKIGAQTYTEPKILAQMYKALIEDRTDMSVEIVPDLAASPVVISAMKENEIQMATLYTGEIFNGYFEIEQTKDRQKVLEQAQKGFDEHYGFKWFDGYGFQNTYAFTVRKEVAEKNNLKTISDVQKIADNMRLGVDTTWLERDNDGYGAFKDLYGYEFGETFPMEIGLVYEAVANDEVDIVLAYSTDARIKEFNLQTLEDDKMFFPPYDASPVIRKDVLEKHPELEGVISTLVGQISESEMVSLNYEVDVNKRSEDEVAKEFLKNKGWLK